MNKRIQELIKKATTLEVISGRGFDTTQYNYRFNEEKFAELIVRECLSMIANEAAQYAEPVWAFELVNDIKDHFGVEE